MNTATRRHYLLIILLLTLLLLGLLLAYRILVRPPMLADGTASREGYESSFSMYGFGPERLSRPSDVAIADDGRIYVADTFNHRIVVYDRAGRYVEHFGEYGTERMQIEFPSGVALAPDGTVFVLCKGANKVVIYDERHEPTWVIDVESPQVATVHGDRLYLATHRGIMIGDLEGSLVTAFGRRGREPGQLDHPGGIAVGEDGTIYLADSLNYRVQALDTDGKSLWVAGSPVDEGEGLRNRSRRFGLPVGLALGDDGLLYLVDAFTGTLQVLDAEDGREIARYGEWGHEEGMFYYPAGLAHGTGSTFAVADKFNDRVQVLQIYSPLEPEVFRALRGPGVWFLPLVLLPLAFLLIRRRTVADRAFLEQVLAQGALADLRAAVSRVEVTDDIKNTFADIVQDGVRAESVTRASASDSRTARRLADRYGLTAESAELLARAARPLRLPAVLLADDQSLAAAAQALRISLLGSAEVLDYWGVGQTAVATTDEAVREGS